MPTLLSLSNLINITLLAQPDTVCTTRLTCWYNKETMDSPEAHCTSLTTMQGLRYKHNIHCYLPLHLQTGLWKLHRDIFCNQLCFCWQRVPVPGEEKSCSEEKLSHFLSKKFISLLKKNGQEVPPCLAIIQLPSACKLKTALWLLCSAYITVLIK